MLARVGAFLPYELRLPAIVGTAQPLTAFVAIVGPPGVGKSSANAVAAELLPTPDDVADLPVGTGEGIVEALFDWVQVPSEDGGKTTREKQQVRHNVYIYVDEGATLAALGGRNGATIMSTLRSIFSGAQLGNANAGRETHRVAPAGSYTYGVTCGFQDALTGVLLDDAVAGTPQRFLWARGDDPHIPDIRPPWPGRLFEERFDGQLIDTGGRIEIGVAPKIVAETETLHAARMRGEIVVAPLDEHRNLIRLKVAGRLAILDSRLDITDDDWQLAGMIVDRSDTTRAQALEAVKTAAAVTEHTSNERRARTAIHVEGAVERRRIVDTARRIATKVWAAEEPITQRGVRNNMSRQQKKIFDDALDHAVAERWVQRREEAGSGEPIRLIERGMARP